MAGADALTTILALAGWVSAFLLGKQLSSAYWQRKARTVAESTRRPSPRDDGASEREVPR